MMTRKELKKVFNTPTKRRHLIVFLDNRYQDYLYTNPTKELIEEYLRGNDGMPTKDMQRITRLIADGR